MADLTELEATLPVKIVGAGATGVESNYVDATANGLKVDGSAVVHPVSQSGTWTVQQGTPPWTITGNVASGATDSGNPVKVGGIFNTTQPTVTTGQRVDFQSTNRGAQIVATGVDNFNINNISGTVSLPTLAATSTKQSDGTQKTQVVDGSNATAGPIQTLSGTNYFPVVLAASATPGAAAVARSVQVAGSDGTNAQTLSTDATGKLNINNISGTITLPTLAATSTKQSDGTQKSQTVDGSGNVQPSGDILTRKIFVQPTDGSNNQAYTASGEAKVLVTALTNSSIVKAQLQDNSGNGLTSQANGAQRALDIGINVAGVQVDPRTRTWTLASGTDSIAAVQSGTWTVQQGTPPWSVTGNVASGSTDSGNPIKTGGIFNTTQPTVTTGQRVDSQSTARGAAIVATGVDNFNINNISGTITLPTLAATSTKQSDGTQKTQIVDGSGNVQPSGDVLTRKIFVQPTDGSNNQSYTASGEAKVLVTALTNSSIVKAQLQDNAGNGLTSQANGAQRALDIGINVAGVQVDPRTRTWTLSSGTDSVVAVGNVASGAADSGNPVKIGGIFNTTQPTVTNGQRVDAQSTARGAAIVATGTDSFNINNITGTVTLPTLAATSTKQSDGTQKTQIVDGSGNVQPSGDVLTRKIFVQPTDGSNNQGYTASNEAKVLVTPLTNTSVVKAQLQDNAGNGLTSQASSAQRALDVGVNVSGVQVDPRTIFDTQSNFTSQVDLLRALVVATKYRGFGDSFSDGFGMANDSGTFPSAATVAGVGTGTVSSGYLQLRTGSSANGNSSLIQSLKVGSFFTGSASAFQSGVLLPASPTAFRVVSRIASVDTQVAAASFNVATTTVPDGNFHRYEIYFQGAGTAHFYADGLALHRMSGQVATPRTGSLSLPLRYEISTTAGVTTARYGLFNTVDGYFFEATYVAADITLGVRGSTFYRTGPENTSLLDESVTSTITANGGIVSLSVNSIGTCGVYISNTWVATLQFEGSIDGTNFFSVNAIPIPTGAQVTSTSANGQWRISTPGLQIVRVRASAFTSGTVTLSLLNTDDVINVNEARLFDGSGNSITQAQKPMATSIPVVLSSDQTGINSFLDKSGTGSISALNGAVTVTTNGMSTIAFSAQGTFVATLQVQGQAGDNAWDTVIGYLPGTGATSTVLTGASMLVFPVGGFSSVRLIAIAYTSGTANIQYNLGSGVQGTQVFNLVPASLTGTMNLRDGASNAITSTLINSKQRLDIDAASDGVTGSAVPFQATYVGGKDIAGLLQPLPANSIDASNSTAATLTANSTFTGTFVDVTNFSNLSVIVFADQVSATDGLKFEYSTDGTNVDDNDLYTVPASNGQQISVPLTSKFYRIRYTNGTTNQGAFRLQSKLHAFRPKPSSMRLGSGVGQESDAEVVMSVNGRMPLTASAPATVSAGVASGTLIAANTARKGLVVINTSSLGTISLHLNNGSAVLNSGITLYPHDVWYMDEWTFTTAQINVIASLAATGVAIQEMT